MTKEQFLQNITRILEYYKEKQSELRNLNRGISHDGKERDILSSFLDDIGLEKNPETYYAGFMRLSMLKEESLILYLDSKYSDTERKNILHKAYLFSANYHTSIQNEITEFIEINHLLTPFYLTVWKSIQDIGVSFNTWFPLWQEKIPEF